MAFFKQNLTKGIYLMVLTSSTSSSARLFLSHSQDEMDAFYPPLPHDTRLAHAISKDDSSDSNQVLITWKVVERVRLAEANRYRFCAIASRRVPDWAICGELNEGLESIHCVPQTNNSMVIHKLRSGRHYFITVFVRDSLHGSTSSYETLEVNLRRAVDSFSMVPKKIEIHTSESMYETNLLHDGVLETGQLSSRKGSSLDYQFIVPSNTTRSNKFHTDG
ncbi:hypothetical protein DICVIV_04506 [Dictyocaulus viviparus]|uniref:Uncharacterized protein n=1 Tax=Dictyocaulus viviparus TaxID=29172 RepID=A0A0D8Y476_DICVI|nr:hypothetical protein DICVIV_04506 [Dictyocaulus viviparus]